MDQEQERDQQQIVWMDKGAMAYWATTALNAEGPRIAATLRIAHLAKTGRSSPDTEKFLELCRQAEAFADAKLAQLIAAHPTWPWAQLIKGVGKENFPKCVGLIEKFGRYYDLGDPMIPIYVKRAPELYLQVVKGKVVEKEGIWVAGIERLETPSKLWKYIGWDVDSETGEIAKRRAGHMLSYNADLKMSFYRLGTSLLRAGGIWYHGSTEPGYSPGYEGLRTRIVDRTGAQIVPTPKERMCLACNIVVTEKKTRFCPTCGEKLTLKEELPGYMFTGHLHMRAMREMLKDFSLCMWLVWREALGLPVTQPYKVVKLGYKPIDPWKMVGKQPEGTKKTTTGKRAPKKE